MVNTWIQEFNNLTKVALLFTGVNKSYKQRNLINIHINFIKIDTVVCQIPNQKPWTIRWKTKPITETGQWFLHISTILTVLIKLTLAVEQILKFQWLNTVKFYFLLSFQSNISFPGWQLSLNWRLAFCHSMSPTPKYSGWSGTQL